MSSESELRVQLAIAKESLKRMAGEMNNISRNATSQRDQALASAAAMRAMLERLLVISRPQTDAERATCAEASELLRATAPPSP